MKAFLGILAAVVAFMLVRTVTREGLPSLFSQDVKSRAFLSKVAAEVNKKAPMRLDSETEMVSAQGLEGVLVYKYRLVNLDSDQVDPGLLKTKVKPELVSGTCNTQALRDKFFEKGVTLRYTYFGRDEALIGSIDVTPADCGL